MSAIDVQRRACDSAAAMRDPLEDDYAVASGDAFDLVGPQEIALWLGVQANTVHQWNKRGLLPAPLLTISGVPIWHGEAIEAWGHETGRLS